MTNAGILPPEWTGFSQLLNLFLNTNNISGTLPIEWGQQGAFSKLFSLRLDDNQLTGEAQHAQSGLGDNCIYKSLCYYQQQTVAPSTNALKTCLIVGGKQMPFQR